MRLWRRRIASCLSKDYYTKDDATTKRVLGSYGFSCLNKLFGYKELFLDNFIISNDEWSFLNLKNEYLIPSSERQGHNPYRIHLSILCVNKAHLEICFTF